MITNSGRAFISNLKSYISSSFKFSSRDIITKELNKKNLALKYTKERTN